MRGFLLTVRKAVLWNSFVSRRQFRMLMASMAVGVLAGVFMAHIRLNLGMPGHKALFWMTPAVLVRLIGRCKAGTTASTLSTAFASLALGGNLAGGWLGLPLVGFAGVILDLVINFLEKHKISFFLVIPVVGIAGIFANLLCLLKRFLLPAGVNMHVFWGISGIWFKIASYAFFGLLAGIIGSVSAFFVIKVMRKR